MAGIDGVALGDKLHTNFTDQFYKIGQLSDAYMNTDLKFKEFENQKLMDKIMRDLAQQRLRSETRQNDWHSGVMNALATGRY